MNTKYLLGLVTITLALALGGCGKKAATGEQAKAEGAKKEAAADEAAKGDEAPKAEEKAAEKAAEAPAAEGEAADDSPVMPVDEASEKETAAKAADQAITKDNAEAEAKALEAELDKELSE